MIGLIVSSKTNYPRMSGTVLKIILIENLKATLSVASVLTQEVQAANLLVLLKTRI
jgi:hypothetical protein